MGVPLRINGIAMLIIRMEVVQPLVAQPMQATPRQIMWLAQNTIT